MNISLDTIELYGPRVLIKIGKRDSGNKMNNGLFVPDSAVTDAFPIDTAKVLAVGDGYIQNGVKIPVKVVVGSTVILPVLAPKVEIELDNGQKVYIVGDNEIVAKI